MTAIDTLDDYSDQMVDGTVGWLWIRHHDPALVILFVLSLLPAEPNYIVWIIVLQSSSQNRYHEADPGGWRDSNSFRLKKLLITACSISESALL
jgi:hypothetical protein